MKGVALQNAVGAHLGFMLCSVDLGEPSGECVFIAVPVRADLFDTPEAEVLFQRREAGESAWLVSGRDPLLVVVRTPGLPTEMFLEFDGPGPGRWGVGSGSDRRTLGVAVRPPGT